MYTVVLRCIALHCIASHCIELHFILSCLVRVLYCRSTLNPFILFITTPLVSQYLNCFSPLLSSPLSSLLPSPLLSSPLFSSPLLSSPLLSSPLSSLFFLSPTSAIVAHIHTSLKRSSGRSKFFMELKSSAGAFSFAVLLHLLKPTVHYSGKWRINSSVCRS